MFLSSYEGLRANLRAQFAIETMAHTGPRAFAEISGEKVNTTAFVLRETANTTQRENSVGVYFRLVHAPEGDGKRQTFAQALQDSSNTYQVAQHRFDAIPGRPWVYWIPKNLQNLFSELPQISDVASPRAGMHGGDRFRFARYWWEVGNSQISYNKQSEEDVFKSGLKWVPYMKGGSYRKWYGNQEWVLAFDRSHYKILSQSGNKLPSRQYYFKEGITYSAVTSGGFSCRISPGGFIFDAGGSSLFPEDLPLILACLNSSMVNILLQILNPTVNIQSGDIKRLPVPMQTSETINRHYTD